MTDRNRTYFVEDIYLLTVGYQANIVNERVKREAICFMLAEKDNNGKFHELFTGIKIWNMQRDEFYTPYIIEKESLKDYIPEKTTDKSVLFKFLLKKNSRVEFS